MQFFDCFSVSTNFREPGYRTFPLNDENTLSKRKKKRLIYNPNKEMRVIHGRLMQCIAALRKRSNISYKHVTAFEKGCSAWKNVIKHWGNRHFYLTDLRDAYGHVGSLPLAELISELDESIPQLPLFTSAAHAALKRHCFTPQDTLVTGGVASPALFNLYLAVRLDAKLSALATKYGFIYTRYCDDLTFSHPSRKIGCTQRRNIRRCIAESGFEVAHHKTQVLNLDAGPIIINGIGIVGKAVDGSRTWETFVPGHYRRRIKGMMNSVQFREGRLDVLRGLMALFFYIHGRRRFTRTDRRMVDRFWEVVPKKKPKKKRQKAA